MNETTLPPSPNWYLSTVLSCSANGTVAWGSKNFLVVAEKPVPPEKTLKYSVIPNIHNEKVNSLSFCPESSKNLIVTAGNDHILKLWSLQPLELVSSKGYLDADQKIIGVDWSKADVNLICAVSDRGNLISWNTSFNTHQISSLGKITATCIACSPHKSNSIAIGTKSGLVLLVNQQGSINYKLRGHDVEIVSLSWCPSPINTLKKTSERDYLLASGAKDRKIFLWRTSDGRYETEINLPSAPQDNNQHRCKLNNNVGAFTVILWVDPNILVAGSTFGELLFLKISSVKGKQRGAWRLIHGAHSRAIFSIASWVKIVTLEDVLEDDNKQPKPIENENWQAEKEQSIPEGLQIWTIGQERQIISVLSKENEDELWQIEHSIPTLAGYVYCIAACPLDPSTIALGVGDGMLRVWNLSEPHETIFNLNVFWQKIMGRITAIAWHPEKENLLAYGTSEGRIGVYDTCNPNKPPNLLHQHHRKTIYRLQWGPSSPNDKNKSSYSLYSCGDGELVCFNCEKHQEASKVIIKKNCSELSWKPDYSCLAVGHTDGSISFFDKNLKSLGKTIFLLKKSIEYLAWHPDSTATDLSFSNFKDYLAASANSPTVTVFDMSALTGKLDANEESGKVGKDRTEETSQGFFKVVATLTGHSDRVFSLTWSPHISGYLASGSLDTTTQVWKIDTQQLIGTYTGHCGGVQSVMWSPVDADLIISGSNDWSLRIWRLSDQKPIMPLETTIPKEKSKKSKKSKTLGTPQEAPTLIKNDLGTVKNVETALKNLVIDEVVVKSDEKPKEGESKSKSKRLLSHFTLYNKQMKEKEVLLKTCLDLAKQIKDGGERSSTIFGGKEEVLNILQTASDNHWHQGQWKLATETSLWGNSLRDTLIKAKESHTLNDFIVSLAPSLSMKLWQEICEAYANQLLQEGNFTKAVSYFLVIHKIRPAIEVLMQSKLFKEAYAVARCKLDPDDPLLKEITDNWAVSAVKYGFFEEAAQCMIVNGEFSEAARILARRKDALTLETAAQLAIFAENKELSDSIAEEALNAALSGADYEQARGLIAKFSSLEFRTVQVETHEEVRRILNMEFGDSAMEKWFQGEADYGWIELKKKLNVMGKEKEEAAGVFKKLEDAIYPNLQGIYHTEAMLWLKVSRDLALAAGSLDDEKMIRHVVSAIADIAQYELMNPMKSNATNLLKLLARLETTSPLDKKSIFKQNYRILKSLRAYLCLALLNWLVERIKKNVNEKISIDVFLKFVEESIESVLDKESVNYCMSTGEVTKLETALTKVGQQEGQKEIIMRLEKIKQMQKKFVDERIQAPSPMVAYSRAMELGSLLEDQEAKARFIQVVSETWKKATSSCNEG